MQDDREGAVYVLVILAHSLKNESSRNPAQSMLALISLFHKITINLETLKMTILLVVIPVAVHCDSASSGYRCVCVLCCRRLRWMGKGCEAVESALGTRGRLRAVSDVIKAPY